MQNSQNQRYGIQPESNQAADASKDYGTRSTAAGSGTSQEYGNATSSYTGLNDRNTTAYGTATGAGTSGTVQSTYTGSPVQSSYTGTPVQSSYSGTPVQSSYTGSYGTTGTGAGYGNPVNTGYTSGSYGTQAGQTGLQQQPMNLTQAGVSNFSQQVNTAYQHLQQVQRELTQTQNQIEVQAQAQIRQIRQLQQLIDTAGTEIQQIEALSRTSNAAGRNYMS
ncbi:hypothetical protein [Gorillibacterium sp. sgz5001074]|uniref:hypothetical protein n=1 Tax=Gorillibacterium sp. sgz5001074 TaxID=3446695 RepID=UPI003F668924